ncbi:hypothetical protein J6590_080654 [Homalodisca vitripennis]|nr:hypothetical protein J6590_080654 [Homalodisca vitripennis]
MEQNTQLQSTVDSDSESIKSEVVAERRKNNTHTNDGSSKKKEESDKSNKRKKSKQSGKLVKKLKKSRSASVSSSSSSSGSSSSSDSSSSSVDTDYETDFDDLFKKQSLLKKKGPIVYHQITMSKRPRSSLAGDDQAMEVGGLPTRMSKQRRLKVVTLVNEFVEIKMPQRVVRQTTAAIFLLPHSLVEPASTPPSQYLQLASKRVCEKVVVCFCPVHLLYFKPRRLTDEALGVPFEYSVRYVVC